MSDAAMSEEQLKADRQRYHDREMQELRVQEEYRLSAQKFYELFDCESVKWKSAEAQAVMVQTLREMLHRVHSMRAVRMAAEIGVDLNNVRGNQMFGSRYISPEERGMQQ